jgi:fructose/tagatose bisphosphate aldolase
VEVERIAAIRQRVRVPLVIHGGTSFPREAVPAAIANGAVKFNIGTALKLAFFEGLCQAINHLPARVNVHAVLGSHSQDDTMVAGRRSMQAQVQALIRLYGTAGQATMLQSAA